MTKNLFILAATTLILISFSSCEKLLLPFQGKPLKLSKVYDEDGDLRYEYLYEDGKIVRENSYNSSGSISRYYIYTWDSNDRIIRREAFHIDGEMYYYLEYQYKSNGNLEWSKYYSVWNGEHKLSSIYYYEFNASGLCTRVVYNDENDETLYIADNAYNRKNRTRVTFLDPDENQIGYINYQYDDKHYPYYQLATVDYGQNNITRCSSPYADEEGYAEFETPDGYTVHAWTYSVDYEYNEKGYPTFRQVNYDDGDISFYTYEYLDE